MSRSATRPWLAAVHSAFTAGALLYAGWTLVVILAIPWLFGISQGNVADLPSSVQYLVYERSDPILLKCPPSPHIYLLDDGEYSELLIKNIARKGYMLAIDKAVIRMI